MKGVEDQNKLKRKALSTHVGISCESKLSVYPVKKKNTLQDIGKITGRLEKIRNIEPLIANPSIWVDRKAGSDGQKKMIEKAKASILLGLELFSKKEWILESEILKDFDFIRNRILTVFSSSITSEEGFYDLIGYVFTDVLGTICLLLIDIVNVHNFKNSPNISIPHIYKFLERVKLMGKEKQFVKRDEKQEIKWRSSSVEFDCDGNPTPTPKCAPEFFSKNYEPTILPTVATPEEKRASSVEEISSDLQNPLFTPLPEFTNEISFDLSGSVELSLGEIKSISTPETPVPLTLCSTVIPLNSPVSSNSQGPLFTSLPELTDLTSFEESTTSQTPVLQDIRSDMEALREIRKMKSYIELIKNICGDRARKSYDTDLNKDQIAPSILLCLKRNNASLSENFDKMEKEIVRIFSKVIKNESALYINIGFRKREVLHLVCLCIVDIFGRFKKKYRCEVLTNPVYYFLIRTWLMRGKKQEFVKNRGSNPFWRSFSVEYDCEGRPTPNPKDYLRLFPYVPPSDSQPSKPSAPAPIPPPELVLSKNPMALLNQPPPQSPLLNLSPLQTLLPLSPLTPSLGGEQ
jgi:hypothetical protein